MLKLINYRWLLLMMAVVMIAVSCDDEEDPDAKPVASFQAEIDDEDFLKVNFKNFSQNAVSYSWDFGDGSAASTEEEPSHTYEAGGTYQVKLTATGADGSTHEKTEAVTLTDPNTLSGSSSKSWKLLRDPSSGVYPLEVGPNTRSEIWWALGLQDPIGVRPCLMNDEWIFDADGTMEYKTNGDFWGDGGVWHADLVGCNASTDAANFTNVDGEDISAWGDGVHEYDYDAEAGTLTVTGEGAFIALQKAATDAEVKVPQESVTYQVISLAAGEVADTLVLETTIPAPGYWRFVLVHYHNPADEPEIPGAPPVAAFSFEIDGANKTVAFTNESTGATSYSWDFGDDQTSTDASPSHQYAADGRYDVTLTATNETGESTVTKTVFLNVPETEVHDIFENFTGEASGTSFENAWFTDGVTLTLGAENPATGETALVGKYERGTAVGAHISNTVGYKIDLSTRNVFKMKVYLPSSNDYTTVDATAEPWASSTTLAKTVALKLQNSGNATPWTDQAEVRLEVTELDQWVELTFDFSGVSDRTQYDRVLIQIGGEGHKMPGTFYLTDLELQ